MCSLKAALSLTLSPQLGDKKLIVQRASVGAKTMAMANIPAQIQVWIGYQFLEAMVVESENLQAPF